MDDVVLLMVLPFLIACVLLAVRNDRVRGAVVGIGAAGVAATSIAVAAIHLGEPGSFLAPSETVDAAMFAVEAILGTIVIALGIRFKRYAASVLGAVQLVLTISFEFVFGKDAGGSGLYLDDLGIAMVLIVGVIGSLICVYAVGYMRDYQEQTGAPDRRPWFFFLLFTFLSAMFGIVLSDDLSWMFFFWEITTLCSFALIGFTRTGEAEDSAFRQLTMNLVGGIAFVAALIVLSETEGVLSLSSLLASGPGIGGWALVAVILLAVSGIVKSALMPFHTWLLGAMVAPTPTSALLHSSTMVKAGVFVLLKLSPLLHGNIAGCMTMTVGGVTFLLASMAAISQSNAKRVLAYSTISNLGLIAACAGVGTADAVWAGIMLMIFHAVTKSLLFLCVGTAEHRIGSRNIEDMDLLFDRMPRLARVMMIGIAAMFLAPFGMLVAKWSAFVSFLDPSDPLSLMLVGFVAFGSAATGFYWTKWLGKLSCSAGSQEDLEGAVRPQERFVLAALAIMAVAACLCYPLISGCLVAPWVDSAFPGGFVADVLSGGNALLLPIMAAALAMVFLPFFGRGRTGSSGIYMSGLPPVEGGYSGSMGDHVEISLRNWYLEGWFGEKRIGMTGEVIASAVIAICIATACWGCMT